MLLLTCPWCGERSQPEFTYGGDASIQRPDPLDTSTEEWLEHVYLRENRRGPHLEWWQHTGGCRQWLKVVRNTFTHEVIACGPPDAELGVQTDD